MDGSYILDGKKAVPIDTSSIEGLTKWSEWYRTADRRVASDEINHHRVSTVFLGLDHSYLDDEPLLFETMIFGPTDLDQHQERCSTWEEAEAQHERACNMVRIGTR